MEHRRAAAAADTQERLPVEDRQQAHGQPPGPEELPDDYAQWLDGWMFATLEQQQEPDV